MRYREFKRTLDILVSSAGLAALSPLMLLTAIAIKVESDGPIIFRQKRIGLSGKTFWMFKFRSMCVGAEKGGVYEKKGDSRVTAAGRIIRAVSIDELPQFINILRGEMSIIGPRPVLTYHPWPLEKYTPGQMKRFSVRPGVTGWAQVNGRKEAKWEKRIEYDVEYAERMSLEFDMRILFMTVLRVFTARGNLNTGETAAGGNISRRSSSPGFERCKK
jgi:lipopolysaccharide/colanic/teichoic acid biosynthesis glycosyltransferase